MMDVTGALIFSLPFRLSSSMRNATFTRSPPSLLMSVAAADAVPPVARRSSIRRIFSPGWMASW